VSTRSTPPHTHTHKSAGKNEHTPHHRSAHQIHKYTHNSHPPPLPPSPSPCWPAPPSAARLCAYTRPCDTASHGPRPARSPVHSCVLRDFTVVISSIFLCKRWFVLFFVFVVVSLCVYVIRACRSISDVCWGEGRALPVFLDDSNAQVMTCVSINFVVIRRQWALTIDIDPTHQTHLQCPPPHHTHMVYARSWGRCGSKRRPAAARTSRSSDHKTPICVFVLVCACVGSLNTYLCVYT
jgi:hypothetical protein